MPGVSQNIAKHLLSIERELVNGTTEQYEARLAEDALVVVPGAVFDKPGVIEATKENFPWDGYTFSDERVVEYDDTVVVNYRFDGCRGDERYEALLSSVYVTFDQSEWFLALHQQTLVDA